MRIDEMRISGNSTLLHSRVEFSCGGGVKFHRRHTLSIQVKSVAVKLSEKQLSKAVLWQSPFPLTLCLTYFIMPTIIFLRIIGQFIGGACGGILGTMLGQMADGNASAQNPASDRNRKKGRSVSVNVYDAGTAVIACEAGFLGSAINNGGDSLRGYGKQYRNCKPKAHAR